MGMTKHSQNFQNLKKEVRDKVDFFARRQSFSQVDLNTLGTKVSCKVILLSLMDVIKHSQSAQINRFAISLQYLKNEVQMEFLFCMQINNKVSKSWHYYL